MVVLLYNFTCINIILPLCEVWKRISYHKTSHTKVNYRTINTNNINSQHSNIYMHRSSMNHNAQYYLPMPVTKPYYRRNSVIRTQWAMTLNFRLFTISASFLCVVLHHPVHKTQSASNYFTENFFIFKFYNIKPYLLLKRIQVIIFTLHYHTINTFHGSQVSCPPAYTVTSGV